MSGESSRAERKSARRMFGALIVLLGVSAVWISGCFFDPTIPDQSQYKPLSKMSTSDQAVSRVYAAAPPFLGPSVVHTWILVKSADSQDFDRWELWVNSPEHRGDIHKNMYEPEEAFGLGCYVVAEQVGPEAQKVKDIVEGSLKTYPYPLFHYLPGPNCNTYIQWVLDQAGWDVELPSSALGKDYQPKIDADE